MSKIWRLTAPFKNVSSRIERYAPACSKFQNHKECRLSLLSGDSMISLAQQVVRAAAVSITLLLAACGGGGTTTYDCGNVTVSTFAGSADLGALDGTGGAARFNVPGGMAIAGTSLYVADSANHTIRKVDLATGAVSTFAGAGVVGDTDGVGNAAAFSRPGGMVTDGSHLYVADVDNDKIRKIDLATAAVTTLAGSGAPGYDDGVGAAASFRAPTDLALKGNDLYVADSLNFRIRRVDLSTGTVSTIAGSSAGAVDGTGTAAQFVLPYGLAIDESNLYVSDALANQIRKIALATGVVSTLAGKPFVTGLKNNGYNDATGDQASFYSPEGLASDGKNLYVADSGNNEIRKIVIATGAVTTLAGAHDRTTLVDGKGETAGIKYPFGIIIAAAGSAGANLYVSDSHAIRKINYVADTCPGPNVLVGGEVKGLSGTLKLDAGAAGQFSLTQNGVFHFPVSVKPGSAYNVTVTAQPSGQVCTVSNASGTANSTVSNVAVSCVSPPGSHTISGAVGGLTGTVVLQNNGGDNLTLTTNSNFTFAAPIAHGSTYAVSVLTQPNGQTCSVANAAGTANVDVSNVTVTCSTNAYTIGGSVSGLIGAVVLQNNTGDDLTLSNNGSFSFATAIAYGSPYAVSVKTQPSGQTCTITNPSSTVNGAVSNVSVNCTSNTYAVGGSVSGLSGTVVLQNNGGNNLTLTAGGSFAFSNPVTYGSAYSVSLLTQPSGQTCSVANASGTVTATVTNVAVTCAYNTYTIGGTLSGLSGAVVLQNNGGDFLTLVGNGSFTFGTAIAYGSPYAVSVKTQPTGQTCTVTNPSSTVSGTVTNVSVNCASNSYAVGGTVSGLSGTLVLQNNGGNNLTLTADGSYAFSTPVTYGSAYSVSVLTQPGGQTCTVSNSSGTATGTVSNVAVTCTNTPLVYTVGGVANGVNFPGLQLQNNGGDTLNVDPMPPGTTVPFNFATSLPAGSPYNITVLTQPMVGSCTVTSGGSGTVGSGNVTTIVIDCI